MICERQIDCPLLPVHIRFEQSAQLWVQTADSYFDPQRFTTSLNSCIQSLRNVTFILQSNKSKIPEFDTWYAKWQLKMKEDKILRWCVAARNRIVKQGDLEVESIARVQILASYNSPPYSEFKVSPILKTEMIASSIQLRNLPAEVVRTGILLVERRWVVSDLLEKEILEALAYTYGVLSCLVEDAHKQIGVKLQPKGFLEASDGRIPEMLSTEYRSALIKLSTGELISSKKNIVYPDIKAARERYGRPAELKSTERSNSTKLVERATQCFEMAKTILKKDETHAHIAILHMPSGVSRVFLITAQDRSEKYLLMNNLAREVERLGATSVIMIAEAWFAPEDLEHPTRHAVDSPDKRESLVLGAISSTNEEVHLATFFERTDNGIEIGPTLEMQSLESSLFNPIRRVWAEVSSDHIN